VGVRHTTSVSPNTLISITRYPVSLVKIRRTPHGNVESGKCCMDLEDVLAAEWQGKWDEY
jgi:hypothetical protein